jgi:hypothetical protein
MDNGEAKHLIDQYNKLVSWGFVDYQMALSCIAVAIATAAFTICFMDSLVSGGPFRYGSDDELVHVVMGVYLFTLAAAAYAFLGVCRAQSRHRGKILILEEYRAKNRGLPDSITLRVAWKSSRKALGELLAKAP